MHQDECVSCLRDMFAAYVVRGGSNVPKHQQALDMAIESLTTPTMSSGNVVHLINELRQAEADSHEAVTKVYVRDKAFFKGKAHAYGYAVSRMRSLMDWLAMDKDALPTLKSK